MDFICKWEQVFKAADNARVLLTLTVWQHLCSPCVPAVQTSRAGPPACLPPSVLGNPSRLPLSDLTWCDHSYNCLLGCAAINGLQVLFFGVVVIGEYIDYFLPLLGAQPVKELGQLKSDIYITWITPKQLRWLQIPHAGTFPERVWQDRPLWASPSRWELLLLSLTGVVSHGNLSLFS